MLFASEAMSGPCAPNIYAAQIAFDARLKAAAAKGPDATQSTEAKLHRQPTPTSLAQAEAKLGDISDDEAQAFGADMRRARAADAAGDLDLCKSALKEARGILVH